MKIDIKDPRFFYQDVAESIVESILGLFEEGIKSFESYEPWPYSIPISSPEEDIGYFNWRMNVARSQHIPDTGYDLYGLAGRDYADEPSIDITIVLPPRKHQKKIAIRKPEIFEVVSHEIHHLAQNIDNNTHMRSTGHTGKLAYFLDPYEIEAFHIGVRARASLTGESFESIAKNYIRKTWKEGTRKQIDDICQAWKDTSFPAFYRNTKGML